MIVCCSGADQKVKEKLFYFHIVMHIYHKVVKCTHSLLYLYIVSVSVSSVSFTIACMNELLYRYKDPVDKMKKLMKP